MQHIGEIEPVTNASVTPRKSRPYIFLGQTTSLCETCLELVPAKILLPKSWRGPRRDRSG